MEEAIQAKHVVYRKRFKQWKRITQEEMEILPSLLVPIEDEESGDSSSSSTPDSSSESSSDKWDDSGPPSDSDEDEEEEQRGEHKLSPDSADEDSSKGLESDEIRDDAENTPRTQVVQRTLDTSGLLGSEKRRTTYTTYRLKDRILVQDGEQIRLTIQLRNP
jgi:hypothetical protein